MEAGAQPSELVDVTTTAALEEKAKLRRHFGRFDILFFLICTIVGLDTLGAVASNGAQGFTWLIFLCVLFFIPYALLTAELGAAFPEEGGCYEWTKLAFGRFVAGVNSVIYWLSNPIWLGGVLAITALTTFSTFFTDISGTSDPWRYVFLLGFIWFAVWGAILSFNVGKWIPSIGAFARVILLAFFCAVRPDLRDQARRSRLRRAATSSRPTPCSSRPSRCSSSTSSASSCRTLPARR